MPFLILQSGDSSHRGEFTYWPEELAGDLPDGYQIAGKKTYKTEEDAISEIQKRNLAQKAGNQGDGGGKDAK